MYLHTGSLYWPATLPGHRSYPALRERIRTKAVIVGGGMSGAVCGYVLAKSGIPAVLIEQRTVASGSTSSNTGLLQYSNDKMLSEFACEIGEEAAVRFYRACKQAAEHIADIAESLPGKSEFKRRSSLYFASNAQDVPALRKEYDLLVRHGFDADWWDVERISSRFPFRKEGAIVTRGDAEINPFRFVHGMAEAAADSGLRIFENTAMLSTEGKKGAYRIRTDNGEIEAEHIVYAVGYTPETAGGQWIRANLGRSYAIVTSPLPSLAEWHERFMLWETARPYLYARTTADNRLIVGGLDENVRTPVLQAQDVRTRAMRLLAEIKKLFPGLKPKIDYSWCAAFGESADGLPWLGEDPDRPGQHYCLGYGGNGTIYSMLGAQIIRDRILGENNPVADIVKPNRLVAASRSK
ncbi:FAD-binding oxidoreductase [Cohnella faecalis]|uniref:FAD-binding oxidoreductase n=1 Tax=Cohnella faecalis TaxID=2315694 RepID=A0A398CKE6_9BACL|nr:FAD-binding oxidoreductase [Cohnella faecalis]